MSKLQLFRDFVNERLAAAALEICGQYEKSLTECQEELCPSNQKNAHLQYISDVVQQHETMLHRAGYLGGDPCEHEENMKILQRKTRRPCCEETIPDVQQLSFPEPLQIKEEQQLWTSQERDQLQELQYDTAESIFSSPSVKLHYGENLSQLPPLDQTPTVENREGDYLPTNTTEEQLKAESDGVYGASEPVSYSQPCSVTPDWPTAQSLEEEERGGLLPVLKPVKSRRTQGKCSRPNPSPGSSSGPCTSTKTGPNIWTRPIPSSHSGSASSNFSSGKAESKTVGKPYQWEECNNAYFHRARLDRHRIIHTRELYQCEECGRAFNQEAHLVNHRRIHTGEKPYQCEECGKTFGLKGNLVLHRIIHTGQKPYQCERCDKAFCKKSNLVRHRRVHTGEKPYKCEKCYKAFSHKSSLLNHRRIHTGEKPYQCGDCDRTFSQRGNLVNHRRLHT